MARVLLATDGSDQATTAFRTASRMLRREDNEFESSRAYTKGPSSKATSRRSSDPAE